MRSSTVNVLYLAVCSITSNHFNGKQFPPSQYNAKHEWVQLVHSEMRLIKNTP